MQLLLGSSSRNHCNRASGAGLVARTLLGLLLVGLFVWASVDLAQDGPLAALLQRYLQWTASGDLAAILAFALVYAVCVAVMVPEVVLWLGGGYAFCQSWGLAGGTAVAGCAIMVGQVAGNAFAFLLGRALLGDCLAAAARRYALARALNAALSDDAAALRILLLLRLSPLTPNQLLNYLLAGTGLALRPFLLATVAMAPSVILFCALGGVIKALADVTRGQAGESRSLAIGLAVGGGAVTIAAIALLSVVTRRQLRAALAAAPNGGSLGSDDAAALAAPPQPPPLLLPPPPPLPPLPAATLAAPAPRAGYDAAGGDAAERA